MQTCVSRPFFVLLLVVIVMKDINLLLTVVFGTAAINCLFWLWFISQFCEGKAFNAVRQQPWNLMAYYRVAKNPRVVDGVRYFIYGFLYVLMGSVLAHVFQTLGVL